jgi:hypothetical protein
MNLESGGHFIFFTRGLIFLEKVYIDWQTKASAF